MENEATTYELRNLCSKDLFVMSKIISKIGVKEFKGCFESDEVKALIAGGEKDMNIIGLSVVMDVAAVVIHNIQHCEKEVYTFLSNLSGMKEKEIEGLPMNTFVEMIIDVAKKKEFKDFIGVASKLFK